MFLDPKKSFINFNQCDIITPNLDELKKLSGNNIISELDIEKSCKIILNKYNLKYIIAKWCSNASVGGQTDIAF